MAALVASSIYTYRTNRLASSRPTAALVAIPETTGDTRKELSIVSATSGWILNGCIQFMNAILVPNRWDGLLLRPALAGIGSMAKECEGAGQEGLWKRLFVHSGVSTPSRLAVRYGLFFFTSVDDCTSTSYSSWSWWAATWSSPSASTSTSVDPCGAPFRLGQMCFQLPLDLPRVKWRLSGRCRHAKSQVSFEILTARLLWMRTRPC